MGEKDIAVGTECKSTDSVIVLPEWKTNGNGNPAERRLSV
jgi:hypothetical protein